MYLSASALAGIEIIMLLTLQLIAGNMFELTGLIMAGLMTGLAIGSGTKIPLITSLSPVKKLLILTITYLAIGSCYNYFIEIHNVYIAVILILAMVIIPSIITGQIFCDLTSGVEVSSDSSATYSADLSGSAFGFIIISSLVLPVLGIQASIYLLAAFAFTGILFGTNRNK